MCLINLETPQLIIKEPMLKVVHDFSGLMTIKRVCDVLDLQRVYGNSPRSIHEVGFKVDLQQQHVAGVLQCLWLTRAHNYRFSGLISHR